MPGFYVKDRTCELQWGSCRVILIMILACPLDAVGPARTHPRCTVRDSQLVALDFAGIFYHSLDCLVYPASFAIIWRRFDWACGLEVAGKGIGREKTPMDTGNAEETSVRALLARFRAGLDASWCIH